MEYPETLRSEICRPDTCLAETSLRTRKSFQSVAAVESSCRCLNSGFGLRQSQLMDTLMDRFKFGLLRRQFDPIEPAALGLHEPTISKQAHPV